MLRGLANPGRPHDVPTLRLARAQIARATEWTFTFQEFPATAHLIKSRALQGRSVTKCDCT